MIKPIRMLDVLATLRGGRRAMTAAQIAGQIGASVRTIYRDIAALQAMGVPIDGAAGLGYILRPGYHLPPLNFTAVDSEAITVSLALLRRTGDSGLAAATTSVAAKIAAAQPQRGTPAARGACKAPTRGSSPTRPVEASRARLCLCPNTHFCHPLAAPPRPGDTRKFPTRHPSPKKSRRLKNPAASKNPVAFGKPAPETAFALDAGSAPS